MNKKAKIAAYVVGGLLATVVVFVLALPLWIGPVVTGVANGVAPKLLGTDFKLEKFALNPYSGKIFIGGVNLSNPKGFDEPTAVSVESVSVTLSFCSLLSNKIHVYDVTIEKPYVSYVNDAAGSNNFARILANLQGEKEEKAEEADAGSKKKYQIDRICINGTKVKLLMLPTLPIPVPTLTNIGSSEEGASAEEVKDSVWNAIKDKFGSAGAMMGSGLQSLGDGASNLLKGLGEAGASSGDSARKAIENVGDSAKKATEALGDSAKKASEALGNLFKGKK